MTTKREREIEERTKHLTGQDYVDGFEHGAKWADSTNPHKAALDVAREALEKLPCAPDSEVLTIHRAPVLHTCFRCRALAEIDKILGDVK